MFANLNSNEEKHTNLLVEAVASFQKSDGDFKMILLDGQSLNIPQSLKVFSPFLSDLINTLSMINEVPTLIIPDCSPTSIIHLFKILTKGFTKVNVSPKAVEHVKGIMEAAELFNIDVKNLVFDEKEESSKDVTSVKTEKEDGEIDDDDEEETSARISDVPSKYSTR